MLCSVPIPHTKKYYTKSRVVSLGSESSFVGLYNWIRLASRNVFCSWLHETRGNVSITLAVAAVPFILTAGVAVDYVRYLDMESKLQAAADSAALTTVSTLGDEAKRTESGLKSFTQNTPENILAPVVNIKLNGDIANVRATTKIPTSLLKLAGLGSMEIEVFAEARSGGSSTDFFILLDKSASMGIGADSANRQKLMALSKPYIEAVGGEFVDTAPNGCSFACHLPIDINPPGKTIYDLAKENNVKVREDILVEASTNFIRELLEKFPQARIGTIGYSREVRWLAKPTNDEDELIDSLNSFPQGKMLDTQYNLILPEINTEIQKESKSAKQFIIFITDGVSTKTINTGLEVIKTGPINPLLCEALKSRDGAVLVVLEIKYEQDHGSVPYDYYVRSFENKITPQLKQCASPGHFYSASSPADIETVLSEIAGDLSESQIRLSQ